ncbi:hypothetical protein [Corynebacterium sp.]|uniref:hypothetical protein n=1 Tax=Corynebacterium sp. TaxID=1720 RepID=UPI0037369D23
MNTPNLLVVPGSPALVRELAPADPASHRLRQSVAQALSLIDDRPCEIIGSGDPRWATQHVGSFAAWGAPQVRVGHGTNLAELVARYLLGSRADARTTFRTELTPLNSEALTVLVLDGPAGLTPRAPLALVEGAAQAHDELTRLLGGDLTVQLDAESLTQAGVIEPDLWLQLVQLRPTHAELLDVDDTLGVGRYVALWEVQA